MNEPRPVGEGAESRTGRRGKLWISGLGPLALTASLVAIFLSIGPIGVFRGRIPPIEKIAIERITLKPDEISLKLVNEGPDPVTVAQVLVNDAYWYFEISPGRTIPRLGRAQVRIPYPWEPGSAQFVTLLTSTGVTIQAEIPVATETPRPDAQFLALFAMLGVYVGVIPVFLGILWFPFLRRLGSATYRFCLALTLGLLVFLGVDALAESLQTIAKAPEVYQGLGVALIGLVGTILILTAVSRKAKELSLSEGSTAHPELVLAYMIAFGIGTHNLGEGLAIGGAYAAGEVALGTTLVLGFMLHNVTEGVAIVAPIARQGTRFRHLAYMGLLAGIPTILGTWTGAFSFSAIWSVLFLAVGAGAVFQVVWEIARSMQRGAAPPLVTFANVAGFLCGLAVMYVTGYFAAA